jgi:lambda family phage tail tape measure protein
MGSYGLRSLTVDLVANTASFEGGLSKAERAIRNTENSLTKMVERIDPVTTKLNNLDQAYAKLTKEFEAGTIDKSKFELYSKQVKEFRHQVERSQYDKLLNQLDPIRTKISDIADQQKRLKAGFDKGLINEADYTRYNKSLEQMRVQLTGNEKAINGNALSAKQMQWAMRGLPAQFTDIFTSLQGGQNPMTVFIQQGGQIKDMFGGVGPAAKAMGGYLVGLVSPLTLAAGAAIVAGLAYYQGSKEADEFRKAIILTGNAAGTSVNQLTDAAARIDQYAGTHRQAAKALSVVANTGKFTGKQLELVAATAVMMENTVGKAIDETVSEFEKLAKDPAKAVAELNEKYHFLTAGVYEQINALEKAGKQNEAAKLATEAYADAMQERTQQLTENLGYVERAWKSVKHAAVEGWDATLGVGRPETITDQIAKAKAELAGLTGSTQLKVNILANTTGLNTGAIPEAYKPNPDAANKQAKLLEKQIADLELMQQVLNDTAEEESLRAKNIAKSIAGQQKFNDILEATLTKEEKRVKAQQDLQRHISNIRAADPSSALINDANIAKAQKWIDDQYKEKDKAESDVGQKLLRRYQQQEAQLRQQLESSEKLSKQSQNLLGLEQQIADLKNKKVLTADEKSLLDYAEKNKAQLEINAALEQELTKREQIRREMAFQQNLSSETAAIQQQYADELGAFGKGDRTNKRLIGRNAITRSIQGKKDDLTNQLTEGVIGEDEYNTNMQTLESELSTRLQMYEKHYQDIDEARANWQNGASRAFDNYIDSANDVAAQTENLFNNAFGSMEDAIVQFALTGKASFADFARAILADLARIMVKQALVKVIGAVFGGYSDGGVVGGFGGYDSGGYTGPGGKYQPAGIVHKGEVVFSQEDVARNGGVASVERIRKGFKGFSDGGVVGGNYAASAMPASGGVNITQHISVDSGGEQNMNDRNKIGKAYAKAADQGTRMEIAKQLKPGGLIWAAMRGY